ncbi:MAG: hypothetical protein KDD67_11130 [Ignavibacteriae bacterium]|nr:hypothetical protein [Ignavibacteriota bacterium]MCB9215841.1 hypothetical protein [Ignavibacteria bacterium]
MRRFILTISLLLPLSFFTLRSQNLPDRIVTLDPLGDTTVQSDGFTLLPGARLYGEFARYGNGVGATHRWNAKMGGYSEFARWDSSWSISIVGTMEVLVDSTNDIEFNPRAIFWEEGLMIATSAPWSSDESIQFGYTHRCKHDIDNVERITSTDKLPQRTLIYSGPFLRILHRPVKLIDGPLDIYAGASLRFDYFVHTLDTRWGVSDAEEELSLEDLVGETTATLRLEGRFSNGWLGLHGSGSYMLSLLSPENDRTYLEAKSPFAEFGLDFYNPRGAAFTIFTRGEWQRDAGILSTPTPASLLLFGIRASSFRGMW